MNNQPNEIIDLEATKETFGGDEKVAFEMLGLLCESLPEDLHSIMDAYRENDIIKTRNLLHKVEGGFGFFGIPRLKKVTHDLHDAVRNVQSLVALAVLYEAFNQEVQNVMNEFSRMKKSFK